jgi:hypothetical protein
LGASSRNPCNPCIAPESCTRHPWHCLQRGGLRNPFPAIEVGQRKDFYKLSPVPNRKTDSNNNGGISTDFIGMNYGDDWNWATHKVSKNPINLKRKTGDHGIHRING